MSHCSGSLLAGFVDPDNGKVANSPDWARVEARVADPLRPDMTAWMTLTTPWSGRGSAPPKAADGARASGRLTPGTGHPTSGSRCLADRHEGERSSQLGRRSLSAPAAERIRHTPLPGRTATPSSPDPTYGPPAPPPHTRTGRPGGPRQARINGSGFFADQYFEPFDGGEGSVERAVRFRAGDQHEGLERRVLRCVEVVFLAVSRDGVGLDLDLGLAFLGLEIAASESAVALDEDHAEERGKQPGKLLSRVVLGAKGVVNGNRGVTLARELRGAFDAVTASNAAAGRPSAAIGCRKTPR